MPEKEPEDDSKKGYPNPSGTELLVCERALGTSERKLSSMLELGRLIGLDLNLDDMLIQIASKAREVLEADRFNLLLYDPKTDELWTKMVFEIEGKEFREGSKIGARSEADLLRTVELVYQAVKAQEFKDMGGLEQEIRKLLNMFDKSAGVEG